MTRYIIALAIAFLVATQPTSAAAQTPTTTDAATVAFWQACQSIGVITYDDKPLSVGWFDWYSVENPGDTGVIPFCVAATVSPDQTDNRPLTLAIRFYRGTPGNIDADYLLAQIHANQQ